MLSLYLSITVEFEIHSPAFNLLLLLPNLSVNILEQRLYLHIWNGECHSTERNVNCLNICYLLLLLLDLPLLGVHELLLQTHYFGQFVLGLLSYLR